MARVGILTFTNTANYGALFQALALQEVIKQMGFEAQILNYNCKAVSSREKPTLISPSAVLHPRGALRKLTFYRPRKIRYRSFRQFEQTHCNLSSPSDSLEELVGETDVIVVGSDQVWNLKCTGGDLSFFLGDRTFAEMGKVAYAASFGEHPIPEEYRQSIALALDDFDSVSVREQFSVREVHSLTGSTVTTVLDPTLLLDRAVWDKYAQETSERYVFAYVVDETDRLLEAAHREAQKRGIPLVVVKGYSARGPKGWDIIYENDASPGRFLSLIGGAEVVFTSSFHGFCFSLIFEKDVWFDTKEGQDFSRSRIADLAQKLGICGRYIGDEVEGRQIDYKSLDETLTAERNKSLSFLKRALSN